MIHFNQNKQAVNVLLKPILLLLLCYFVATAAVAQSAPVKIWDKTLGSSSGDILVKAKQTADGGYLLGGYSTGSNTGDKTTTGYGGEDYWIVKTDASGNKIWDKTYGGSDIDRLTDLIILADGSYILCGYSRSGMDGQKSDANKGADDIWLVKIDANGNKLWDKSYGGSLNDNSPQLQQTSDGGLIIVSSSDSGISGDKTGASKGGMDIWIIKTDIAGNQIWDKTYGTNSQEADPYIIQTTDGGYFIACYSSSYSINGDKSVANYNSSIDFWVLKLNASGNKVWDKTAGGNSYDYTTGLVETTDGGYVVAGRSGSGAGGDKTEASRGILDAWIIKFNDSGSKLWNKTYGSSDIDMLKCIKATADGGLILGLQTTGGISGDKTQSNIGGYDYWIIKTDANGAKLWDKSFGSNNWDYLTSIETTSDNGYLLAGYSYGSINNDKSQASQGVEDYWIIKTTSGNLPAISSIVPAAAPAGCQVTLTGSDFAGATAVSFNGTNATTFTVNTDGTISATVPASATSGIVSVTTPHGTAGSSTSFTVIKPEITATGATAFCAGGSVQLTASNNATPAGSALNFDGNGNYVNVPDFDFNSNGGAVTVEFWTKANASTTNSRSLFAITTDDGLRFQAHVPGAGNILYFDYGNISGNGRISTDFTDYIGKWTHVALVSAGKNGSFKAIYLNGILAASASTTSDGASTLSTTGLTIGTWGGTNNHHGAVDEFRIWSKVRTQAEIQADMNTILIGNETGLAGYWSFDEGTGTTVADKTTANATGTLTQGASAVLPVWETSAWAEPTYSWSPATGLNTTTGATVTASPTATTTYTVTASYPGGCTSTATFTVNTYTSGTWLGTNSTHWYDPANWCGGIPSAATNVTIPATAPRMPIINSGGYYVNNLTIESSATLTIGGVFMEVEFGVLGDFMCNGTFNQSDGYIFLNKSFTCTGTINQTGGELILQNSVPSQIPAGTYYNVTFDNRTAAGTLAGDITVKEYISILGNFNNAGYDINLAGSILLFGPVPVTGSGKIILENGKRRHNINLGYPFLPNIELNDPYGALITRTGAYPTINTTLNGTLTLTQGVLTVPTTDVLYLNGNITGESNSSYIAGTISQTTPVSGTGSHNFGNMGVTFDNAGGGNWGNVTVTRTTGTSVKNADDDTKQSIKRRWDITPATQAGTDVDLTLSWLSADDNGLFTTNTQAQVWKSTDNGSTWKEASIIKPYTSTGDWRSITATTSSFSSWTVSDKFNPLPVTFISFSGKHAEKAVELNWKTASEEYADKFIVERSLDGLTYEAIGEVKAAGNSNTTRAYNFTDLTAPLAPVHYYRLKQLDFDGTYSYSKVIALQKGSLLNILHVYPNPFRDEIFAELPATTAKAVSVKLLNMQGKVVLEQNVEPEGSLLKWHPLLPLPTGIYLLQVHLPDRVLSTKVVKE